MHRYPISGFYTGGDLLTLLHHVPEWPCAICLAAASQPKNMIHGSCFGARVQLEAGVGRSSFIHSVPLRETRICAPQIYLRPKDPQVFFGVWLLGSRTYPSSESDRHAQLIQAVASLRQPREAFAQRDPDLCQDFSRFALGRVEWGSRATVC